MMLFTQRMPQGRGDEVSVSYNQADGSHMLLSVLFAPPMEPKEIVAKLAGLAKAIQKEIDNGSS